MDYGLFLYTELNTGERFEILKRGYVGSAHRIKKLGGFSFRPLDNDSAEVSENPIIKSTLSLDIIDMGDFDYSMFFTVDSTLWRVVLKINDLQEWSGYVTPESYSSSSEYRSAVNVIARDNLGQLEQIDYNWFDHEYVSLSELLNKACELVRWNFDTISYNIGIVASDGTLLENAVVNVESFRDKTWWNVLVDVLTAVGCQLTFQGENRWIVDNVSLIADKGSVIDCSKWATIDGGMATEIIPAWRELNVTQDYQRIDNFFGTFMSENWLIPVSDTTIRLKGWVNGMGLAQPLPSEYFDYTPNIVGGKWKNSTVGFNPPITYYAIKKENNRDGALYISGGKNPIDGRYIYRQFKVNEGASVSFEISVNNLLYAPILESDYAGNLFVVDKLGAVSCWDGYTNLDLRARFKFAIQLLDGETNTMYYLHENEWKEASKIIEFDTAPITDFRAPKGKDDTFTINARNIPHNGLLIFAIHRPVYYGTASNEFKADRNWCFKINSIKASVIADVEQEQVNTQKSKMTITPDARVKKDIDLLYGELPEWSNSLTYAGGFLKQYDNPTILTKWRRSDNIGGVLLLSEIVARAYALSFNGFKTALGEPTGGKILRGLFPVNELKLRNIIKIDNELYVINSAFYDNRFDLVQLTLRQVRKYVHENYNITNGLISTGGGTTVGGGKSIDIAWSNNTQISKRVYELDETAESDGAFLLIDKPGNAQAKKISASGLKAKKHALTHSKVGIDPILPKSIDAISAENLVATHPIEVELNDSNELSISHTRIAKTPAVNRYHNVTPEGHITEDFHPHGGDKSVDFAAKEITATEVAAKAVRADYVGSVEVVPAMVGCGNAMIVDPETGKAHIWADVGHFRDGFETLEMRYRKMIVSGEELVVNNGGVVASVMAVGETILTTAGGKQGGDIQGRKQGRIQGGAAAAAQDIEPIVTQDGDYIIWPLAAGEQRLTFAIKGEAGIDYQQFVAGDILRYTWRDAATGAKGASGYLTVYAVVNEFTYIADVIKGSPEWLQVGMTLALWGNEVDPSRQGFIVLSAREKTVAIYDGVNSTAITPANLKVLLGNLSGIVDPAFGSAPLAGYGLYSQNCYLKGAFVLRSTGNSVEAELGAVRSEFNTSFEVANGKIESKVSNDVYESYVKQTAEKFEVKADKIELNGLVKADDIMVSGKLKAELIDTDKLTARSIDTRDAGREDGVVITRGVTAVTIYDTLGRVCGKLWSGVPADNDTPFFDPRLELIKVEQEKLELSIGDGLEITHGRDFAKFAWNGITLPPTAEMDMPGVLCAGRVNGTYCSVSSQMGVMKVSVERVPGQTKGVYRLTYNRLAAGAKHFTVPTIYGKTYASLTIRVEDETDNYTDIRVHDNANLNATADCDFNFIIYGENKW